MVVLPGTLRVFLTHRWRGRLPVDGSSVLPLRVWPNDLDLNWHVNNGRYFTLADLGRMDWWLRTGVLRAGWKQGMNPVGGDATAKYSRPLELWQRYDLHSRALGWDERWIYNEHRFVRADYTHATVVIRSAILSRQGRRSPLEWLRLVGWEQPSPALPGWVQDWAAAQDRLSGELRAARPASAGR